MTLPYPWQVRFNTSGIVPVPRMDVPVDPALVADLYERIPDFRRAYEPDGMTPDEFEAFGASARTLRTFVKSYHDLQAAIRDLVLPDPDVRPGLSRPASHQPRGGDQPDDHRSRPSPARRCPSCPTGSTARPVEVLPEQTGPVYNPATGRGHRPRPARRGARGRPRRGRRDGRLPGLARHARSSPAARSSSPSASCSARHREELAALITRDHGKTFPDAFAEVMRGLETVEFACGLPVHLAGMNTPNVATSVDAFTLRGPLGVTAAITPFNFPVMVPMWIYPIALACGNTMVLKPSSHTPGRDPAPGRAVEGGRRPDGMFNVVYGGREAVTAIVEHPDIQAIQFVGSTAVGRYVYEEGTRRGKRVGAYTVGQERHARPARRRHGADRRRRGRRGLRLRRRALHGPDPRDRGRRHGRAPAAAHAGADREAPGRPGHGARHGHGPDLLRRAPRLGHRAGSTGARPRAPSSSSTAGPSSTPPTPTASSSASPSSTT